MKRFCLILAVILGSCSMGGPDYDLVEAMKTGPQEDPAAAESSDSVSATDGGSSAVAGSRSDEAILVRR